MPTRQSIFCCYSTCAVAAMLSMGAVHGAWADELAAAQARYKQELAACHNKAPDEQATCRLEARNAWAEAKRGHLDDVPPDQYQPNARRRCEVHSADDRAACEARMRGAGRVSGSVTGGGLYREIEVITPAPTPSPNPDRKEKK